MLASKQRKPRDISGYCSVKSALKLSGEYFWFILPQSNSFGAWLHFVASRRKGWQKGADAAGVFLWWWNLLALKEAVFIHYIDLDLSFISLIRSALPLALIRHDNTSYLNSIYLWLLHHCDVALQYFQNSGVDPVTKLQRTETYKGAVN